jgi:hypothetical protein
MQPQWPRRTTRSNARRVLEGAAVLKRSSVVCVNQRRASTIDEHCEGDRGNVWIINHVNLLDRGVDRLLTEA